MPAEATLEFRWGVVVHNRTNGTKSVTPAASLEAANVAAGVFVALSRKLGGMTLRELKDGTLRMENALEVIDVRIEGRWA